MTVSAGAEILYTDQASQMLHRNEIPAMCGTEYVLVEFSPYVQYKVLYSNLEELCSSGYVPILAHTERYRNLVRNIKRAEQLKQMLRIKYQVNCSTVLGQCSFLTRIYARKLFKAHLVDAVATDAHNVTTRAAAFDKAWQVLKKEYGKQYAADLTDGSILYGEWSDK